MLAFTETVEDELAGGETLENIGQRFDLDVIKIDNIANNGKAINGTQLVLLERYEALAGCCLTAQSVKIFPCRKWKTARLFGFA